MRAVVGLPAAKQEALLGNAEAKDWTAARLKAEADKARKKLIKHPAGREPQPAALETIRRWQRELEDAASFADIEKLADLDEDERTVSSRRWDPPIDRGDAQRRIAGHAVPLRARAVGCGRPPAALA